MYSECHQSFFVLYLIINMLWRLEIFSEVMSDSLLLQQNSSEELVQSVEHYCDHFRVAPQYPLYMNLISSYANNTFAREQLRKQKATCKAGSYAQVLYFDH